MNDAKRLGRPVGRVLWNWNVHTHPYLARLEAAEAGGFDVLSAPYSDLRRLVNEGATAAQLVEMAAARGVRLDFLEAISGWYPVRYPPDLSFLQTALDFSPEEALDLCAELGVKHVLAISGFDKQNVPPVGALVDAFGEFCALAQQFDIWVDLEPMWMLGLSTTAQVWEVLDQAGCANSGLLFDTWHFERGGSDIEVLAAIPRGKIRNVQFSDGPRLPRGSLWEDAADRRLPGDGELPLYDSLRVVAAKQDVETVGPEAISAELDALSPIEVGHRARDSMDEVMREIGWH